MRDLSFKDAIKKLRLKPAELSRLLSANPDQVQQWYDGVVPVPDWVSTYLTSLTSMSARQRAAELARVNKPPNMLDEGVYKLSYSATKGDPHAVSFGLAVLRDGKILGSNHIGGVLSGRYQYDVAHESNWVEVQLKVPKGSVLVTGFIADTQDITLDIAGLFARATPTSRSIIEVAGRMVDVRLRYLGDVPH